MSHGLPPLIEALLCVATLVAAVLLVALFEATLGRWLRGRYRYRPPESPEPRAYDASAWAEWPADGGVT